MEEMRRQRAEREAARAAKEAAGEAEGGEGEKPEPREAGKPPAGRRRPRT